MRCVLLLLVLAGCNMAFGIEETDLEQHRSCERDADQLDEDGDGMRNSLDTCPGIPDPLQSDTDNDGVGDACDPDADGENAFLDLAYFEAGAGCWVPGSAEDWSFDGDATSATARLSLLTQRRQETSGSLEFAFAIVESPPVDTNYDIRVQMNHAGGQARCSVRHYADGGLDLFLTSDSTSANGRLTNGTIEVRMLMTRAGGIVRCEANGVVLQLADGRPADTLSLALESLGAVRFHHAVLYSSP